MAEPIDPGVDIGHVHLKVADVDRALGFYCGVLGFYWDRPRDRWPEPKPGNKVEMYVKPLDVQSLLAEL